MLHTAGSGRYLLLHAAPTLSLSSRDIWGPPGPAQPGGAWRLTAATGRGGTGPPFTCTHTYTLPRAADGV